ncbi:sensory transduction protein kinase, partial [Vibrio parahaemolyticus Peru-466]
GLVIVQRICERMGWPFELNDDGVRFSAKVTFVS